MRQIAALIRETLLESLSKKIVLAFALLSTLALLVLAGYCLTDGFREQIANLRPTPDDPSGLALLEKVRSMQSGIGGAFYTVAVLIAIFITADIVPSMMEKGVIDFLLSKPLQRSTLLAGKVLGGLAVVLMLVSYFTVAAWLVIALATGVWTIGLLASMLPILLTFLSLYAVMVFLGILTRSGVVGMMVCYLIASTVSVLLFSREEFLFQLVTSEALRSAVTGLYYIVPQVADMGQIASMMIQGKTIMNTSPFLNVAAVSVVFFGLSAVAFERKEF